MRSKTYQLLNRSTIVGFIAVLALIAIAMIGAHFGKRPIVTAETPTGETKSVMVRFKDASPVTAPNASAMPAQQQKIADAATDVQSDAETSEGYKQRVRTYENLPYASYIVDAQGEQSLKNSPNVALVFDDVRAEVDFDLQVPTIGGTLTGNYSDGATNYTGNGYAVVVIDTGVDKNHPSLAGKVIAEACFSENTTYSDAVYASLCPGGATSSTAVGSGQDCTLPGSCGHGTNVAGAIAMAPGSIDIDGDTVVEQVVGSGKDTKIVAIKVVAQATSATVCPSSPGNVCAALSTSGILAAMDYATTLSVSVPIAAVNTSLGFGYAGSESECNASPLTQAFRDANAALRARNIAWVSSNGNDGDMPIYANKIRMPACAGAVAVGATNVLGTAISSYSNNSEMTTLLAPGGDVPTAPTDYDAMLWLPENGTAGLEGTIGTSFSTPIVAGAIAVLREKHPNATVDQLVSLLQSTGTPITESRPGYTTSPKPRINVAVALASSPLPVISSFTGPSGTINEGQNVTLAATVANAISCSLNNGIGAVAVSGGVISASVPVRSSYVLTCTNGYNDAVASTVNFAVNAAPTAPIATNQVVTKTDRTLTLSWAPSTDTDGIDHYLVALNSQLLASLPDTETSYVFTDLMADVNYVAEVRAVDVLGAVSSSLSVSFSLDGTTTADGSVPGAPNTGVFGLFYDPTSRVITVLSLGVGIALVVAVSVIRQRTRSRQ